MDVDATPIVLRLSARKYAGIQSSLEAFETPESPFVSVAKYSNKPLLSGYADERNRDILKVKPTLRHIALVTAMLSPSRIT